MSQLPPIHGGDEREASLERKYWRAQRILPRSMPDHIRRKWALIAGWKFPDGDTSCPMEQCQTAVQYIKHLSFRNPPSVAGGMAIRRHQAPGKDFAKLENELPIDIGRKAPTPTARGAVTKLK